MRKIVLGLFSIILLLGCATPEKPVQQETVFYPMPPVKPRLQFLTSITSEEDIGKKQSALEEFLLGKLPPLKMIDRPYDIGAVKGAIYISDRTHKNVLIIDLRNKTFDYIKSKGLGSIQDPAGIWVTEDGYKYVADFGRKQVLLFDNDNNFVRLYGEKDQFGKPLDVAVYKNKIYVCDFDKHQILVLDKDSGATIQTIGESGMDEGKFYKPTHVIVDKKGNIYVDDSFNYRIQKFSPEGQFVKAYGFHGDGLGAFARPKGIAVDNDGHLYAVDAAFENVQIFDEETAQLLLFFGKYGPDPGDMYLPNGIYIDYTNIEYFKQYEDKDFRIKYLVYVGNMLGEKKLNVYGFGDWVGAPMPGM
ncbi:MAG: 6-bladed beta-propeller [Nitrospirota bacterium]